MDIIIERIKDPSNYAPVLSVLCVTFGLYLLVIVWARREDRKDRNKVSMRITTLHSIYRNLFAPRGVLGVDCSPSAPGEGAKVSMAGQWISLSFS